MILRLKQSTTKKSHTLNYTDFWYQTEKNGNISWKKINNNIWNIFWDAYIYVLSIKMLQIFPYIYVLSTEIVNKSLIILDFFKKCLILQNRFSFFFTVYYNNKNTCGLSIIYLFKFFFFFFSFPSFKFSK